MICKILLQKWVPTSLGLVVLMLTVLSMDASALTVNLGDDVKVDLDTTLNYGSSWRMEDPDPALLGSTGNRNFDKGDQINSAFNVGIDMDAQWKNYGLFMRGRGLYDTVYANDSKFRSKTEDRHGKDAELLDAFVYGDFDVAEMPLTIRIGRQSVSWGEGLFVGNSISTAQSPLDLTKGNTPGVELKDLFLPTGQVYSQISTADSKMTLATYYKWEWETARFDESGSFFSTNDALDEAGTQLGPFARGRDLDAEDGGEYGVAVRYLADSGTEYGLFYINYHETLPMLMTDLGTMTYYLEYQEDVELYGASISGVIGDVNVSGEVSYRPNLAVSLLGGGPLGFHYEEGEVLQTQISAIYIMGDIGIADNAVVTAEWGYNRVLNFDNDELSADKWATGGAVKLAMDYYLVADGLDLQVPIVIKYNPKGTSAAALSGFIEDSHSVSVGFDLTYLGVYKAGLKYTSFIGDVKDNKKTDRDFLALNFKYTF